MTEPPIRHRTIPTNGIEMHVAEAGEGPPVVLCHGFPELWYSWRHQLPVLAAPPEVMEATVADLRGTVLIPGVGHWTQQEAPGVVNDALLGFLREIGW